MENEVDKYRLETLFLENPTRVIHTSNRSAYDSVLIQDPFEHENRWYRGEEIGHGTYSTVYVEESTSDLKRAVKVVRKNGPKLAQRTIKRELAALAEFSKPREQTDSMFVEFLGWFEDEKYLFLAMEYFPLGDLGVHIGSGMEEDTVKTICAQVLRGLIVMHQQGYAHRDLKPQNIFVVQTKPQWKIKIGDFGISKRTLLEDNTEFRTEVGTPGFEAPEIRGYVECDDGQETSVYTRAVDIWSLGCLLYKLITNEIPFQNGREVRNFCSGKKPFPAEPLKGKMSSEGVKFLEGLLKAYPLSRPTAGELYQNAWLQTDNGHGDTTIIKQVISANPQSTLPEDCRYISGPSPLPKWRAPGMNQRQSAANRNARGGGPMRRMIKYKESYAGILVTQDPPGTMRYGKLPFERFPYLHTSYSSSNLNFGSQTNEALNRDAYDSQSSRNGFQYAPAAYWDTSEWHPGLNEPQYSSVQSGSSTARNSQLWPEVDISLGGQNDNWHGAALPEVHPPSPSQRFPPVTESMR
ncbi:kinase-like domain-containing protein [Xylogone sp. PMI_703]|nr:kinase-like domain-containing protein [Xylogone sp. PMI_703]